MSTNTSDLETTIRDALAVIYRQVGQDSGTPLISSLLEQILTSVSIYGISIVAVRSATDGDLEISENMLDDYLTGLDGTDLITLKQPQKNGDTAGNT